MFTYSGFEKINSKSSKYYLKINIFDLSILRIESIVKTKLTKLR